MSPFPRAWSRIALRGTVALTAALSIAGIGAVAPPAYAADAPAPVTVRMADQIGSEVDYAAMWVAEHEGYYKQAGITIKRDTYANGPESLLHLSNGEEDGMVGGLAPIMQAAARGTKFVMVMSITKGNAPLVGSKDLTSYKDLNGKTVASPGIGTVHDAMLTYAADKYKVTFKRVFGKVTDFVPMLQRKEIDAFIGWEPAAASAVAQDPDIHYIAQLPPLDNAESLEMIFTPAFVEQHHDTVKAFVKATLRGIDYMKHHSQDDVAKIVAEKMGQPGAIPVVKMAMKSVMLLDPKLDMPSTRVILKTASAQGKIPPELVVDVDAWMGKYIDYSFQK